MKILMIDDDVDFCFLMNKLLSRNFNIEFKSLNESENYADAVKTFNPDVIILDIALPGKDGISILKELRENSDYNKTKIVIISVFSRSDLVTRSLKLEDTLNRYDVCRIITKPIDIKVTVNYFNELVRSFEMEKSFLSGITDKNLN